MKKFIISLLLLTLIGQELCAQVLACHDNVKVALGSDGLADISADMLLVGGPYDYQSMTVVPSSVSNSDVGVRQYTVTSTDGNVCWGALEVFASAGQPLSCYNSVEVLLDDAGQAILTPAQVLAINNPVDYSSLSITPPIITSAIATGVYTVTDETTGNSCWGSYMVLNSNPNGNSILSCNDHVSVSVEPWTCSASISLDMILEGGPYDYSSLELNATELDLGQHIVTVTDTATGNSCWGTIDVEDKTPPVVVIKADVVVSLLAQQDSVKLFPQSIDNGSFDSCSEVTFSPEFWTFTCADLGQSEIVMTVTDEFGNFNTIAVDIKIEYDGDITLDCTEEVVVSCIEGLENLVPVVSPLACQDAVVYNDNLLFDYNADGEFSIVVGPDGNDYFESGDSGCDSYVFERTWSTDDEECAQVVFFNYDEKSWDPTSIVWPTSKNIDCLDDDSEVPTWTGNCDGIIVSLSSDTLSFNNGVCAKIINEWTLLNWCTAESFTNVNILTYTNNLPPELLTPSDLTLNGIPDELSLSAIVETNCLSDIFAWEVTIDLNSDSVIDMEWRSDLPEDLGTSQSPLWDDDDGNGVPDVRVGNTMLVDNAKGPLTSAADSYIINIPFQFFNIPNNVQHRVLWKVFDSCGNATSGTSFFRINASSTQNNPTPICNKFVSVEIEGTEDIMVWARDFNGGSFDDMTSQEDLRYTFSDTDPNFDPNFNEQFNSSFKEYSNVTGPTVFTEMVYVWDEDGNSDFCLVQVLVTSTQNTGIEFSFPEVIASPGDYVCMPLYARNLDCVLSVDGSITWNSDVLQYSNIENISLPAAGSNNFNTVDSNNGVISFSWFDITGMTGFTLPATVPLFEVCFDVIGTEGTSSVVSLVSSPTQVSVSAVSDKNDPSQPVLNLGFTTQAGAVSIGDTACSESSIQWPHPQITLNSNSVTEATLSALVSPDNLISVLGFSVSDVRPTYNSSCNLIDSYNDQTVILGAGEFIVVRNWVILNWDTAETYSFTQTIKVNADDSFICDFLSNEVSLGDCDSGHTDTDDVEWPADIVIEDHRIQPDELIAFSGISEINVQPIFFNAPNLYKATYKDFLDSLTQEFLIVGRLWSVTSTAAPGSVWNYRQQLNLDLAKIIGLVSTTTISNRAIPDVSINNFALTDENGLITLSEMELANDLTLSLSDDIHNGLTIRDLVLMHRHLLGTDELSPLQLLSADVNQDNFFDLLDFGTLESILLGRDGNENIDWNFVNSLSLPQNNENTTIVVGKTQNHIGIKPGDLDDDAIIDDIQPNYNQRTIRFEDQLFNLGQAYEVPIILDEATALHGIELSFDFDSNMYEIIDITSDHFNRNPAFFVKDGILKVILMDALTPSGLGAGDEIIKISLRAIANSILSTGFGLSGASQSLTLSDDMELHQLVDEIDGTITTGISDQELLSLSTYPNPVNDVLYLNTSSLDISVDYTISVFDLSGFKVLTAYNVSQIDVSKFESGLYLLVLESEEGSYAGKISVVN